MDRGRDGDVSADAGIEDLLRALAPQVLGALVRRYGQLRRVRGRGAGGAARRRRPVARRGRAGEPARLADHGRVAPADRPAAQRAGAPPARGPTARDAADEPSRRPPARPPPDEDDTLTLLFLCCHPALSPAVAGRAHPARRRRPDHRADRQRVPRARGDDGPAHQPGQADASRPAASPFAMPPERERSRAAARGPARALPDLQRGLHGDLRPRPAARRADARGDPAHARGAPAAARRRRGRRAARADAAHRRAARGAHAARRRARSARRAGPRPLEPAS